VNKRFFFVVLGDDDWAPQRIVSILMVHGFL